MEEEYENLDTRAYKFENGWLKLVERVERKRTSGDWTDQLVVKESNANYESK